MGWPVLSFNSGTHCLGLTVSDGLKAHKVASVRVSDVPSTDVMVSSTKTYAKTGSLNERMKERTNERKGRKRTERKERNKKEKRKERKKE